MPVAPVAVVLWLPVEVEQLQQQQQRDLLLLVKILLLKKLLLADLRFHRLPSPSPMRLLLLL
jgi:hypothetical protein